jgi:guanosine-3',5'-bis(diphosphate) 3'-pyrophosphohydrolase
MGAAPAERKAPSGVGAAIAFAVVAHGDQRRKDGRTPYIVHPMGVLRHVATEAQVADPEILAAAVLHDVLEDTPVGRAELQRRFGPRVTGLVLELTLPPELHGPSVPDQVKTVAILERLPSMSWAAVLVKLCDRWDNLRDLHAVPWTSEKVRGYREGAVQIARTVEARLARDPPPPELGEGIARAIQGLKQAAGSGRTPAPPG